MSTITFEPVAGSSPNVRGRMAGVFYLLTFLTGAVSFMARGKLVVAGDAATTAANILAHESAFHVAFAADLMVIASYVVVTALFYLLFEPVNRSLSLVAAFFSLMGCATQILSCGLTDLAPLALLGGQRSSALKPDQLQALTLLSIRLGAQIYSIGLVFFGVYCASIGWLIFRSTFLPRALGVLMMFAGLAWLTFVWPPLATALSPYIMMPGVIGEGSLTLWLIVMGVNASKWRERDGPMRT